MNGSKSRFYITCNCNPKFHISPFVLPITYILIRFFHDKLFKLTVDNHTNFKILKYNLPYLFYLYLPKIFSIILIPIIKFKTKSETDLVERNNIGTKKYHEIKIHEYGKKILLLLCLVSFLEVLYDNIDCLVYYYQMKEEIKWLLEKKTGYILFIPIFSYFLLNKQLYRHHLLSFILGFAGAIIINACRFFLKFSYVEDYKFHILNIFLSSIYSFALVLIKYIFLKYVILSPYILLFYDGIFCIIISILLTLLEYFIVPKLPSDKDEFDNYNFFYNNFIEIFTIFWNQNDKIFFVYFFLSMILSFCYYISNIFIIYNYSPYLNILVELILPIDSDVIDLVLFDIEYDHKKDEVLKRFLIQLIGYIILFFGALILNEIVILNFCGFNKNTHLNILKRSKEDMSSLIILNNDNEDDNNSICSEESK